MQCEICKNREANVHLKQAIEGSVREIHVCDECASKSGLNLHMPFALTDILFGAQEQAASAAADRSCPSCHARWSDFKKTSRLGCATCYQTFSGELESVLDSMHAGRQHVGKTPVREAATAETAALRKALAEAVASQNFEEAARLRDCLRKLGAGQAAATEPQRC